MHRPHFVDQNVDIDTCTILGVVGVACEITDVLTLTLRQNFQEEVGGERSDMQKAAQ